MKTLDIEIALMQKIGIRDKLIVPNVSWGMSPGNSRSLHECDLLILSESNYATEIEIKISKGDLKADLLKKHGHSHPYIKYLYYAVPYEMKDFALQNIPIGAGLYTVRDKWKSGVSMVRKSQTVLQAKQWSQEDRYKLARLGALRILNLKMKIREYEI